MRFSTLIVVVSVSFLVFSCGKKDSSDESQGEKPSATGKAEPAQKAPGEASAATPAPATKDGLSNETACAMISDADAAAALGEETKPGKAGAVGCTWDAMAAGGIKFVSLALRDAAMWDQAKKISEDMAKQSDKPFEEVAGLGEAAFFVDVAAPQVVVKVGKRYAEIGMVGAKDDAAKQRLLELAKKVAAKL